MLQLKEKVLQRQQGSYILTVEAGRQLLLSADRHAEASLQEELMSIQARWRQAQQQLEEQRRELATLLRVCAPDFMHALQLLECPKSNMLRYLAS